MADGAVPFFFWGEERFDSFQNQPRHAGWSFQLGARS